MKKLIFYFYIARAIESESEDFFFLINCSMTKHFPPSRVGYNFKSLPEVNSKEYVQLEKDFGKHINDIFKSYAEENKRRNSIQYKLKFVQDYSQYGEFSLNESESKNPFWISKTVNTVKFKEEHIFFIQDIFTSHGMFDLH